jgi:hypothetical protein
MGVIKQPLGMATSIVGKQLPGVFTLAFVYVVVFLLSQ